MLRRFRTAQGPTTRMAALTERKIEIVRTLVQAAPDKVVGGLHAALAETSDDSALGGVRRLVEAEFLERALRNAVLQPIAPMCVGGGDPQHLAFPSRALALIWQALKATEAGDVEQARQAREQDTPPQMEQEIFDRLIVAAARGVRARSHPDFAAAAELCDEAREGGAELLANCLDMGPIVRRATGRLGEWIAHPGGETTAAARLAYKDVVAINEDAGPRFFLMLAAQMAHPWMVLRVISAVMDKPPERYLADSELAAFGERLLSDIDHSLNTIAALNPEAGAAAARETAKLVELVLHQIVEFETCVELQREGGWGGRIVKQRSNLAGVVERRLKDAEKAAIEALPTQVPRGSRLRRPVPVMEGPPEPRLVTRATALLSFSDELRTTANYGGFGSARTKLIEKLSEYIGHYVEEVVDHIRTDDITVLELANAYLEVAADLTQLVLGDKAGELVRRRAHAAIHPEPPLEAAG
jgi:hypothetical protein